MELPCATAINPEIADFISHNKIASVCVSNDNTPHCFNCFYALLKDEGCMVFKSSDNTKHMQMLEENHLVAGTIVSSEISMTKIEGIQFGGIVVAQEGIGSRALKSYYSRYPFAVAVPGKIWVVELQTIKYTNTNNGIKHKSAWDRNFEKAI